MDTTKLKTLISLDQQRKDLEEDIEVIKKRRAELETEILDDMAESGISSLKIDGKTVYLKRELWCSPRDGDRYKAVGYLKKAGMDFYLEEKFSAHSLSAYVREQDKAGEPLPAGFDDAFKVSETFKVRVRKA